MNEKLSKYGGLICFLKNILSEANEILLFDVTKNDLPLLTYENKILGSLKGTEMFTRNLVLNALKSNEVRETGMLLNRMLSTDTGKIMKSSIFFLKNNDQEIECALCINMKCDVYLEAQSLISKLLQFNTTEIVETSKESYLEYKEPSLDTITSVIQAEGIEIGRITPDERLDIICELYDLGIFEIKGAVSRAAQELGVSEQSVYRYITRIKKARE